MPTATLLAPPKKLRIAVFNRIFSPSGGGAERYSIALVEQLSARHEIHVFAQHIDHQWPGVTYHKVTSPLSRSRWINQLWFATATWWATRSGFDVIHSHENTWHGGVQTVHVLPVKYSLFHDRTGWRLAQRWLQVITSPRLLVYLWLERLRYAPRPGLQVVVTSETLRPIMTATYPECAQALAVVTPGITFPPPKRHGRKTLARAALGLQEVGTCLLFVGNDYRKKGLETLLRALVQLPPDVTLAVAGNAAHIAEFRALADSLALSTRVSFLGSLKNVALAYEAADCLVHPSLEDTFAMVVLEALAHGLPVIVSSAVYCGISGLLQEGVNALLLDQPTDADRLALVLQRLLSDTALQQTLSWGALAFAANYPWDKIALQQEAVYLSANGDRLTVLAE